MSALRSPEPTLVAASKAPRDATSAERRLRRVDNTPEQLAHVPFVAVLVAILALGMVGLLILNTKIQTQADQLKGLNDEAIARSYEQAELNSQVETLRSTSYLEQRAYALGMRPNPHPAFILLPDGTVVGTPRPVTGRELPNQYYSTWQQQLDMARAAAERVAAQRAEAARKAQEAKQAEEAAQAQQSGASATPRPSPASPKPSPSPSPTGNR